MKKQSKVQELPAEVTQTIEMKLDYKYTDNELKQLGKRLSECYFELGRTETEKKSVMAEFKAKTDAIDTEIQDLSTKIKDGSELRDVECDVKFHSPKMHEKTIVRLDTGEIVGTIPMEDEDYTLFNQPDKN